MFKTLTVEKIVKETEDCVSVRLAIPVDLQQSYVFLPGQYLTFRKLIDGEDIRRSYSICSSNATKDSIEVAIKKVAGGVFSTYANTELQEGDVLDTMSPMGKFTHISAPAEAKSYLLVAAGSGITPILCILRDILENEPNSQVTLLYGNKAIKDIIFKEHIEGLKNTYLSRLTCYNFLSRQLGEAPLFNGHINAEKIHQLGKFCIDYSQIYIAYLCGPEAMLFSVKEGLEKEGIAPENIKFELFTSASTKKRKGQTVETKSTNTIDLLIIHHNKQHKVTMHDDETVLDSALNHGTDLPYACKGGVCATCKAKLEEGSVDMEFTYGLEPEEVKNGYILTCQAYPTSQSLKVNFDKAL